MLSSALTNLALHEVAAAGPAAARLLEHGATAVRADAVRLLAALRWTSARGALERVRRPRGTSR